ncbi:hypothetical protein [Limosilactobacillus vaginalis]|uniref:hypothetical protein n=1 Tax=Limosilactobacillus vaginalis TaxID=1633 RepID=UPI0024BB410D|nr:hypothetical protein [Limosilactobacillus vaginalis]
MRNYGHLPPCRRLGYRIYATINRDPELLVVTRLLLCQRIRIIKQFKDVNAEVIRAQVTSNSFDNTIIM